MERKRSRLGEEMNTVAEKSLYFYSYFAYLAAPFSCCFHFRIIEMTDFWLGFSVVSSLLGRY